MGEAQEEGRRSGFTIVDLDVTAMPALDPEKTSVRLADAFGTSANLAQAVDFKPIYASLAQAVDFKPIYASLAQAVDFKPIYASLAQAVDFKPIYASLAQAVDFKPIYASLAQAVDFKPIYASLAQALDFKPIYASLAQALDFKPIYASFAQALDSRPIIAAAVQGLDIGPVLAATVGDLDTRLIYGQAVDTIAARWPEAAEHFLAPEELHLPATDGAETTQRPSSNAMSEDERISYRLYDWLHSHHEELVLLLAFLTFVTTLLMWVFPRSPGPTPAPIEPVIRSLLHLCKSNPGRC